MEKQRKITLSIEASVGGGSLSILDGSEEIGSWSGNNLKISKAEDLLQQVGDLLKEHGIRKEQVELICVSKDTASATGEKIGRAIAKGLSKAYDCRLVEVPLLNALSVKVSENFQGQFIVAIMDGNERVFWQCREKKQSVFYNVTPVPLISAISEFYAMLNSANYSILILSLFHSRKIEPIKISEKRESILVREFLAKLIGIEGLRVR